MLNRMRQFISEHKLSSAGWYAQGLLTSKGAVLVILAVFAVLGSAMMLQSRAATPDMFVFGTGGDHAANEGTRKMFQGVGAQNLDFFLSLGDLGYAEATPPDWCKLVKDNINIGAGKPAGDLYGENYLFPTTYGNHERTNLDQYLSCLPDRMNSTAMPGSTYGRDYYYDYPSGTPLARFIVMAPGMDFAFAAGSTQYNWLNDTIDAARAAGIKWVIVANHFNYISTGENGNQSGSAFFNLVTKKKVDLLLQGHEHNYQRSHQLALSTACPSIVKSPANTACVVGDGSTGQYVKDKGMVLVISGASGQVGRPIIPGDSDAPYFTKAVGDVAGSYPVGFNKITVTADSLKSTFVSTGGSPLEDSFEITAAGTGEPTPTPTPSPVVVTQAFAPVADAKIQQAVPTTNFGAANPLLVDGSPVEQSLMKFVVSETAGYTVKSAKLRLYVANASPSGGSFYRTADTGWAESTVNWNTAPAADATPFATVGAATLNTWVEVDATSLIKGDGTYSIRMTNASADNVGYRSKEAAANKPQLLLTLEPTNQPPDTVAPTAPQNLAAAAASASDINLSWTASTDDRAVSGYRVHRNGNDIGALVTDTNYVDTGLTPGTAYTYTVTAVDAANNASPPSNTAGATTAAASPTATFQPTADSSVKAAYPTTNYGGASVLHVDSSSAHHFYMKFTVTGSNGRAVTNAKLRLRVADASQHGGTFYSVSDTAWGEKTINWNNAPAAGTTPLASLGAVTVGSWVEVDVTGLIKGDGTYSLRASSPNTDLATYKSKETADKPQLVVAY